MFRKLLAASALLVFCACDKGVSPTEPDPPEWRSPVTIQLTSFEPANGTTLKLGDRIWLFGTYTINTDKDIKMSFVLMRDDGASYTHGFLSPQTKSGSWQYNFAFESDPKWGRAYSFSRGHNISILFVAGDEGMVRFGKDDYSVDWSHVEFKQGLGITYHVQF